MMIMMIQLYIDNDDDDDNHCEKLPVDSKHQHPPAHHVPKYQHGQIVPIFNDTQTIPIYRVIFFFTGTPLKVPSTEKLI